MPLTIQITVTPVGPPISATPEALQTLADEHGEVGPGGGAPVAITIPIIRQDQTGLNYDTRDSNSEFRFNTGTLKLTLRQEIHVSSALSPCAKTVWLQHEQKHVQDNERIMARMDTELRANAEFDFILIHPTWQRVTRFADTQRDIRDVVNETFLKLTSTAATKQDTAREYQSVERQIKIRCGSTVGKLLKRDSYGQGVDLVQLALNAHPPTLLPLLKVDGVFGSKTEARVREFQRNNGLVPDGIVGSLTRAALGL
jgi:peptidoglycan hydrolase-like protein with peptidoglycan-binding domain